MRIDNFGLKILGGDELDNGLVLLMHTQKYKIRLVNYNHDLKCNAKVEVDGKVVGNFRIEANSSVTIERPANDTGQFTFYRHGTSEAKNAGLTNGEIEGVISVSYLPEADFVPWKYCKSGGTGLSGESSDRYIPAQRIAVDPKREIVIKTRLVCHDGPRPLI